MAKIVVRYSSVDGCSIRRSFATVFGARAFAAKYVGPHPEIGRGYAVSADGIGKVTVEGATLVALFPADEVENDQYYDGDDWGVEPDPDAINEYYRETRYAGQDNAEAEAYGRYEDII